MTQPPSPSAAALALADWMRSYFLPRGPWAHPDNRLDVATKLQEFAAQAVAAAQGDYARMESKIKAMRKEARPSHEAQSIRSAIIHELDEDNEFTDLACDLVDIAAERGLAAERAKPVAPFIGPPGPL